MKTIFFLWACLFALGFACGAETETEKEIPLSSIASTCTQPGLLHTGPAFHTSVGVEENRNVAVNGAYLNEIHEKTHGMGASNVFLVDAPNINGAVSATASVFVGARSANDPAALNQPNPPRGSYWLVAYLGVAGSDPNHWFVDKVTVEQQKIRFAYRQAKPGAETMDLYQYLYWAPLGSLVPGVYQLELFDNDANAVTLSRRVTIGKKPN